MAERYVIDYGDGTHQTSADLFADLTAAQAWQAQVLLHIPVVGSLTTQDFWRLTPEGQSFDLDAARELKITQLVVEGISRLPTGITSLAVTRDIILMVVHLTPIGVEAAAVLTAFDDAVIDIIALPTVPDVQAYNVVTDPNWP